MQYQTQRSAPSWFITLGLATLVACLAGSSGARAQAPGESSPSKDHSMSDTATWTEVARLIDEQQYQSALDQVTGLRQRAHDGGDSDELLKALIYETQLQAGLHGYERAVRFLRQVRADGIWPNDPGSVLMHRLLYAHSLRLYQQAYDWQIRQRERTAASDADLDQWTLEQIGQEIDRSFLEAWGLRDGWADRPVGDLSSVLDQNSYPARIRGTLRDSITHLWVGVLEDQSLWTPQQSNESRQLDLGELLGAVDEDTDVDAWLSDPEIHPLRKIGLVLADLESWHRAAGRPEAAFDARRALIGKLTPIFDQDEQRLALRSALESALERLGPNLPWWTMGSADLAEMLASESRPWALRDARDLARRAMRAFPDSVGARRCAFLVERWEAPRVELRPMQVDGARRRSVQVEHANLEQLYWRALPWDIESRLRSSRDQFDVNGQDLQRLLGETPLAAWQTELPATPDLRNHRTYVTPPLDHPGSYVLLASTDPSFDTGRESVYWVQFRVSELALWLRSGDGELLGEVRSAETGEPLAGVQLEAWRLDWRSGHRKAAQGETDTGGRAQLAVSEPGNFYVVARTGDDSVHGQAWMGRSHPAPDPAKRVLVYTDRSIYRPGQTIQWKIVAFEQDDQRAWIAARAGETVEVTLSDGNFEEVASAEVVTNEWGSASGTFEIGFGRALGGWSIETSLDGEAWVQVEEYKRPTFEVEIHEPAESPRFGADSEIIGEARYYFGAPVTEGKVSWRVTRSAITPFGWGWRMSWWHPTPPTVVASGEARLEADGTFRFSFVPEPDRHGIDRPEARQVPYAFRVEATVVDPGGETREGSATLRAGHVTTLASIAGPDGLVLAAQPIRFDVARTNLAGAPAPGDGTWRLLRLESPAAPSLPSEVPAEPPYADLEPGSEPPLRTAGDLLRPRWETTPPALEVTLGRWQRGDEVASGTVHHAAQASEPLEWPSGLAAGAYVLVYETEDTGSATTVRAESFVAVFGDSATGSPPLAVYIAPLASTVEVGQSAEVLVHSGWPDQTIVVEAWGREGALVREVLQGGRPQLVRVPVTPELRGRLIFEVSLVRDHQELRQRTEVSVPWSDKKLQVELSTFRDLLRPGSHETWTVTVRDPEGEALAAREAEVLASMYDRSLDLFAAHGPPQPEGLWPTHTEVPAWMSSVGHWTAARSYGPSWRGVHEPVYFTDDELTFFDGFAIGGPGMRGRNDVMRTMAKMAPMPAAPQAAFDGKELEESITVTAESPVVDVRNVATGSTIAAAAAEPAEQAPEPPSQGLRSDFSETAFWQPHLLLTDDGSVSFEFQVPDAVTQWRVWLRALTSDFRAGSFETTVRSSKDLLVRPYLPRFFREGDRAELRVVVSNQGQEAMAGRLDFDVIDPDTEASRLADFGLAPGDAEGVPFEVAPGGQTTLRFAVTAPKQPGGVAVRVLGTADGWSDGELRPLPVLPSRLYLSQSRFAVLDRAESRTLRFDDLLQSDDPTRDHESLVMTLDGQLLTTVLNALPYLVEYPYSCTEQSLNRFVSTGIVTRVFADHPMVAELAKGLSEERGSQFEVWQQDDPNRQLLLEETPWLRTAGGGDSTRELRRILDPEVATRVRDESLERVLEAQTASGAFPWWPGGPPSPYMTLYVLDSFSRALEFGVEVPQEPVVRAWQYLETHFRDELAPRMAEDVSCCLPVAVYLNWMLSNYPDTGWTGGAFTDADRQRLLDLGFRHWKELAPRIKGYLALTLQRMDRGDDARRVWDSVMDSAKTDEDLGTYWAPEKMAWLWYNDTIETHAFALRVLAEVDPADARRSGLAQWLLVQKKLNQWQSTRATAEVIYSLVHYLRSENLLGIREVATVKVGDEVRDFVFAGPGAEASDRRQQWVIEGDQVTPAMGAIEVSKETPGFLMASATWHFATDRLPEHAEGDLFRVERTFYRRVLRGDEWTLEPLAEGARVEVGDQLEVQLDIRADHAAEYVHLRDPRGAGFEPEDLTSGYRWDILGHYREIRDSATNFFFDWLPAGQYVLKYRVRAATAGAFRVGPAQLQSMYAPEFVAYSSGAELRVDGSGS